MQTTEEWSHLKDFETVQGLVPETGQYKSRPGNTTSSKLAFFFSEYTGEIVMKLQSQLETY